MPHVTNEVLRKSLHIAIGFGALTLKWLPWHIAAAVCLAAVFSNWLLLHRVFGTRVARHERGFDEGTILYPAAVLVLVVVFRNQLHYAAIAWAMLAFGDGVATLAGKWVRIASLPWNRDKSWGGLIACFIAAAIAGIAIAHWMDYRHPVVVLIAAAAAAVTESLALHVDDNVTVPFAAAVALMVAGIAPYPNFVIPSSSVPWLIANGVLALAGYFMRSVSFSGAVGGWILGAILILCAGWPMYVALLVFFVIGTAATKLGYQRKAERGLAQEGEGRRGFSHAFSNVGVAAICAIALSRLAQVETAVTPMIVTYLMGFASLATAAADTTASEIGQLIGRRAFLPLTLRRVPVGTEGAISIEGTLAGLVAGLTVAAVSVAALSSPWFEYGVMRDQMGVRAVVLVTLSAFLGSYLESIAGSWNRKRIRPVPNGALNFFNTATGALLMYGAWQITT